MASNNSITDLFRLEIIDISDDLLTQFFWGFERDKNQLFQKFFKQIEDHVLIKKNSNVPLYFGHFEFFELSKQKHEIVDGKQRLISLLIILERIFLKLKSDNESLGDNEFLSSKICNYYSTCTLKTKGFEEAHEFLKSELKFKSVDFLYRLIAVIENAEYSQRIITNKESKFQLQANLGRFNSTPTNLKQFEAVCYESAVTSHKHYNNFEVINRFEKDFTYLRFKYESIKWIISEDDLFDLAAKCIDHTIIPWGVKTNVNWFENHGVLKFKYEFIDVILQVIKGLNEFFNHGQNASFFIHEYVSFNYFKITLPFVVKAYMLNIPIEEIISLTEELLNIELRHEVIAERKTLELRLFEHFLPTDNYKKELQALKEKIKTIFLANDVAFHVNWNNENFSHHLDKGIFSKHQKFMLWVYENALRKEDDLEPLNFQSLEEFEVINLSEDQNFDKQKDMLGNLLLVHKNQPCPAANDFRKSLLLLCQQHEVYDLLGENDVWTIELLEKRHERVKTVIYNKFR